MSWTRNPASAFTLAELLVAMGITVVLVGLLSAIVNGTVRTWERSVGGLVIDGRAAQVLNRMAVDLHSAVLERDGREWIEVDGDDEGIEQLRFFSRVSTTSSESDEPTAVREVVYQVVDDDGVPVLYRGEGAAKAALARGFPFEVDATDPEFLLAEGLVGWTLEFYDDANGVITDPGTDNWPVRARISVRLMTDEGMLRWRAQAVEDSGESSSDVINQTSRIFSRDILLREGPR